MEKIIFINNNGYKMEQGKADNFSNCFDWIVTAINIIKNKEIPKTIFIKTDYLPHFVNNILDTLKEEFILITGCSDYSPVINFYNEYNIIINHDLLKAWYTNNNLSLHPKMFAYPSGICSNEDTYIENLLSYRNINVKNIKIEEKVLCIWRNRDSNVCGDEYITRDKTKKWIEMYHDLFDWIEPTLNIYDFYKVAVKYKYILCPVGNGVDPCPKAFEAIILKALPIIIKTQNTKDVYKELPCILVDDFNEILEEGYLEKKYNEYRDILDSNEVLDKLTCQYWSNKIKNTI
jgi:hypothetical protein